METRCIIYEMRNSLQLERDRKRLQYITILFAC